MPAYRYRALSPGGSAVEGSLQAEDLTDLGQRLQAMELELIQARRRVWPGYRARPGRRELRGFMVQLHQSLRAGLPLLQVLEDMAVEADHGALPQIARQLKAAVQAGQNLGEAMGHHPSLFDPVTVALIQAGESSGRLDQMLESVLKRLAWEDELNTRLRNALLYPAMVALVVGGVCLFMLFHLVPQLKGFLATMGLSLPWHTRLLFGLSDTLRQFWMELGGVFALVLAGALGAWQSPAWAVPVAKLKLSLPLVGALHGKQVMARVLSTLSCLYGAGVPLLQSLALSRQVAGNPLIEGHLDRVAAAVTQGSSLSDAFAAPGLCPPLVLRMLRLGESTGGLEAALAHVTEAYQRDICDATARLQALLEPLLILALGGLLVWLAASLLGPLYGLAGGVVG